MAKRILIIEDNEDNRAIYATYLQHIGYEVIEAEDALEGFDLAVLQHPDIILLDIGLPNIDGWQICRWLKANPTTQHIPVIAVSAHAFPDDVQKGLEAGFNEYISKPADPVRIGEAVARHIGAA